MTVDVSKNVKQQAKRKRQAARERFQRAHRAEKAFARKLKKVAQEVGKIIKKYAPGGKVSSMPGLSHALQKYSELLTPWATATSKSLINEISDRDGRAWQELGSEIGRPLKKELVGAQTGRSMQKVLAEQVKLIKSLPTDAAERVHQLTMKGLTGGTRAAEVAEEIMKSGKVTESRAELIARTETTRTTTALVQSRATHLGSEGYIWRTAEDPDVRLQHKRLEGKFIPWNQPPIAGTNGMRYHAGAGPNCRCYPEPVIPDRF